MHTSKVIFLFSCLHYTLVTTQKGPHDEDQPGRRPTPDRSGVVIDGNDMSSLGSFPSGFLLEAKRLEKNVSIPSLRDRSLDLIGRQTCNVGYGYCANFGGCCTNIQKCCPYGYCIEPGDECCPSSPCQAGTTCCGNSYCHPIGTQCCSDGSHCEKGNICVRIGGRLGCCTDLSCTAYVVSGTTTYATTTTRVTRPATITLPPITTRIIVNQYQTWYWTVTWWYFSYYWTTSLAQSTVTYTTIYSTTTYTTEAANRNDASSRFEILSRSLTFETPASATSLKSLFGAPISESPAFIATLDNTEGAVQTSSTRTRSTPSSLSITAGFNSPTDDAVPRSQASALLAGWGFGTYATLGSLIINAL